MLTVFSLCGDIYMTVQGTMSLSHQWSDFLSWFRRLPHVSTPKKDKGEFLHHDHV